MDYKRLTKRTKFGIEILDSRERFVLPYGGYATTKALNRLAELEDKIENGTLVELPCKVGDIFYGIDTNTIFKYMVLAIKVVRENKIVLCTVYDIEFILGKDAFLTKAEAEQKLKELNERE